MWGSKPPAAMFISKRQMKAIETEIRRLTQRISDQDAMIHALAKEQGLVISHNWNSPKFIIQKKEDAKPIGMTGQAMSAPFTL